MVNTVITGGSRGIGAAAVARFAARGDAVTFLYEKAHESARRVERETGARGIACDLTDNAAVQRVFASLPPVDNLILCAGISRSGLVQCLPEQDYDDLFDVNVKGTVRCIRAALPGMLQKQSGAIVTVSSMWGRIGGACESAYSATKGAVLALTKALAKELGPSGIRVNCVAPGVILTDMCACYSEQTLAELAEETPLGRNGTADEVAQALVFLTEAAFITGAVLPVDGGMAIG